MADANPITIADPSVNSCDQYVSDMINLGTGPIASDGFPGGTCSGTSTAQHNYWFSFIMPLNSAPSFAVDIDILGSCTALDLSKVGVTAYVGACGSFTKVNRICSFCNSSSCDRKFFTSATKFIPGTKIYLQIYDDNNTDCAIRFKIQVSPANDYCTSAFDLQTNKNFCNRGGTTTSEVITSPGACSPSPNKNGIYAINNPIWFKFSVTDSDPQPYKISIDNISCIKGGQAMQMMVYDASCPCSSMNSPGCYIACTAQEEPAVTTTLSIYPGAANPGQILPVGNYYLVIDGANGSDCQWKFNNVALPVKLHHIQASIFDDASSMIRWSVEDEKNIQFYEIQRSSDGIHFTDVKSIAATHEGYSGSYQYIDHFTSNEIVYYRIEIVEADGSKSFSKSVHVETKNDALTISTYTIPLGYFTVYPNTNATGFMLSIFDTTGKNILDNATSIQDNRSALRIEIQNLKPGIYFIKALTSNGETIVKKIMIQTDY